MTVPSKLCCRVLSPASSFTFSSSQNPPCSPTNSVSKDISALRAPQTRSAALAHVWATSRSKISLADRESL
ncbi:hypothetical protein BDZ91DRAFT_547394 [Kalaharituber pfeilii]|nr:hypothetical protein BDZ91DRAFT_547394 [Kalaharituber pfeilii]